MKVKLILRQRSQGASDRSCYQIKAADLKHAETSILKYVQLNEFSGEIDALSHNRPILKSSNIYKLDAFMNKDDGLIRVGGRLTRSSLPDETKFPILLPKGSHVTRLIVKNAHERLGHAGRYHVLAQLRTVIGSFVAMQP